MSVQDKNVGFELNDTDFPELSGKLTGRKEKGRRSAVANRHARQAAKAGAFLVKTIDDPNHVLGKKRKERVASESHDGIASHVVYSLNKNKRWEALDDDASWEKNNTTLPVQLVERVLTAKDTLDNVVSLKEVNKNGDTVRHEVVGGKGANIQSVMSIGDSKKVRGRKARKEAEAEAAEAAEEHVSTSLDENQEPKVQYTIYKPHKNHKVLAGKLFNRSYNIRKAGKVRKNLKRVDLDEMSVSIDEMRQSVHLEEAYGYRPSRDFRFCLGDYITPESTATKPVFVRRQSIESVQPSEATFDELEDRDKSQALHVVDISQVLRAPKTYEWAILDISEWEDLVAEVEEMKTDKNLYIQWLDADLMRLSIDASRYVLGEKQPHGASVLMIVVERAMMNKKPHIKVLLNSDIAPSGPFTWQILRGLLKHADSLQAIVAILSKLVAEWKESGSAAPECMDLHKAHKSRFELKRDLFQPAFNSSLLAKPAQVMSAERMAAILRDDAMNTDEPEERFERIDFETDDFDFEDSDDEKESIPEKLKCATCDCTKNSELFELDDCWQCRECLCKHIIEQIRAKCIPLEIPFVLGEGQSAYDILPAIIPLPLLNFYTKIAATESLANIDGGDIGECPSCKQLVHIDANEYNTSSCYSCGIHWCPSCEREPHFPMTCSAYATWIEKWEKEFELHVLNKTENLKRIKCACGYSMEVREQADRAECGGCGRVFCPQNMAMLEMAYWSRDESGSPVRRLETSGVMPAVSVETIVVSKQIKKEFSEVCGEARKLRFCASKKAEFEKAVRKLKNSHAGVEKLRDIRKTVLTIVENGLAYVYTEKKKEASALKPQLTQLMKQWMDIESEVQHPRCDFQTRYEAIEKSLSKVLEQLKQTDL